MIKHIFLILLGAIILSFTSFYNRFPLLTENSGAYIDSGFGKSIPDGGTPVYGFFIAHSSWGFSLWLVVFCQACMLSLIIYYYFRCFSNGSRFGIYYLVFVFSIAFFTAASVSVSTIGAGVFSCISMLAVGLLLFAERLSQRDFFIIGAIALFSTGISMVNLVAIVLLILIISISLLRKQPLLKSDYIKTSWRRVVISMMVTGISWLLVCGSNYALKNTFNVIDTNKVRAQKNQKLNYFFNKQNYTIARYPKSIKRTATFTSLSKWYNWELREACLSKQYFIGVRFIILSNVQIIVCIVAVLLFIYLASAKGMKKYYMLLVFCMAGISSFLVTACFLNAEKNNLGGQLIWLLMLPLFVSVAGYERKNIKQLI